MDSLKMKNNWESVHARTIHFFDTENNTVSALNFNVLHDSHSTEMAYRTLTEFIPKVKRGGGGLFLPKYKFPHDSN